MQRGSPHKKARTLGGDCRFPNLNIQKRLECQRVPPAMEAPFSLPLKESQERRNPTHGNFFHLQDKPEGVPTQATHLSGACDACDACCALEWRRRASGWRGSNARSRFCRMSAPLRMAMSQGRATYPTEPQKFTQLTQHVLLSGLWGLWGVGQPRIPGNQQNHPVTQHALLSGLWGLWGLWGVLGFGCWNTFRWLFLWDGQTGHRYHGKGRATPVFDGKNPT